MNHHAFITEIPETQDAELRAMFGPTYHKLMDGVADLEMTERGDPAYRYRVRRISFKRQRQLRYAGYMWSLHLTAKAGRVICL